MFPSGLIRVDSSVELTGEWGGDLPYHLLTFPPCTTRWADTFVLAYTINTGASKSTWRGGTLINI